MKWFVTGIALLAMLRAGRAHAQSGEVRREVIQGRATRDGVAGVPGAAIVVTMAPDRRVFETRSDSEGRFRVVIAEGTGDYLVHATKIGHTPFRKRYTRVGTDTVFAVDARMPVVAPVLDAVEVIAARAKPPRESRDATQVGASERIAEGVVGALSPEAEGNLAAIAANMPGIAVASDGSISAFGLGASNNAVTLNGMAFAGADLPRDATVTTRVATSAYDPARGWFSGAQTTIDLRAGDLVNHRQAHITADAPALQYGDAISARVGQRISKVDLSYGANGPLGSGDRFLYNAAIQVNRSVASASSLFAADPLLLSHIGVSQDSVARLADILRQSGVPTSSASASAERAVESASFIVRVDDAPYDWYAPQNRPATVKALTAYAKVSRTQGLSLTPVATLGDAGESRQALGMIQGLYSTYARDVYLVETRSALTLGATNTTPYLRVPDGSVLVSSDIPSATGGVVDLAFGGNGALNASARRWTWETATGVQGYARTGTQPHRVKLDLDARLDGFSASGANGSLGSFAFASLDDVAAARPASFSRTLNAPASTGSEWNAFASLGDEWRVSQRLQLLYGVRAEGNVFNAAPAYNASLDHSLGVRTDAMPNGWGLSPRVGFTWVAHRSANDFTTTNIGTFTGGPTTWVRGGVGLFRSLLPASLIGDALTTTGLPGAATRILCLGDGVPTPDWAAYAASPAAIPTTCARGASSAFADRAPSVVGFDERYTAPQSWRGNLAVSTSIASVVVGLDAAYSLNVDQPGVVNRNFRASTAFLTSDEKRPVFVPATAIVAGTGAVSQVPARIDTSVARVATNVSDLRSRSRQVTVTVQPTATFFDPGSIWEHLYVSAAYTLSDVRARARGFDGATFGDPTGIEWARADLDTRHTVITTAGITGDGLTFTMSARVRSGFPFTPLIGQDVNGDGQLNDRAFVFDPAATSDARLASATRQLLATAPAGTRACLLEQIGKAAGRNSCESPWTTMMNARLTASGARLHLPGVVSSIAINLANPLGGLDYLLHGEDHLRGWGTPPAVDPILYNVRGFDPTAQRFVYEVNPRFGATSTSLNTIRAPFRATIDVALDLASPVQKQLLQRWLGLGRDGRTGNKLTSAELVRRYMRTLPDPYAQIIRQADSLLLSPDQVTRLRTVQRAYQARMAAHWTELADYLAALPDVYPLREAYARQEEATDEAWAMAWRDIHATLPAILTRVQLTLLPDLVAELWADREAPKGLRVIALRAS